MKVTILGCGGSGGVPLVGNIWGACNPDNPKNRRRRVSICVTQGDTTILVDTSPDLRAQCLDADIRQLSAILYTHDHADHTQGIDDVRFLRRAPGLDVLPVYGDANTLDSITRRFDYIFRQATSGSGHLYKPFMEAIPVSAPFRIDGIPVIPFVQDHGYGTVSIGYRIGNMAYSTDAADIPEESLAHLHGLDLWIVDCLRLDPHATHAHLDKALGWIDRLKPKQAILTHMNHTLDYDDVLGRCPPGVQPGYDGLTVLLPDAPTGQG